MGNALKTASVITFPKHLCRASQGFRVTTNKLNVVELPKERHYQNMEVCGATLGVMTKYGQAWITLLLDRANFCYYTRMMLYRYETRHYKGDLSMQAAKIRYEADIDAEGR